MSVIANRYEFVLLFDVTNPASFTRVLIGRSDTAGQWLLSSGSVPTP
jgi:hypothetical protein